MHFKNINLDAYSLKRIGDALVLDQSGRSVDVIEGVVLSCDSEELHLFQQIGTDGLNSYVERRWIKRFDHEVPCIFISPSEHHQMIFYEFIESLCKKITSQWIQGILGVTIAERIVLNMNSGTPEGICQVSMCITKE